MRIIKLLLLLALLGSVVWLVFEPGYEPAIAIVTSLAAIIAESASSKKATKNPGQSQIVAKGAIGIQAGGDVKTGNVSIAKGMKNAE